MNARDDLISLMGGPNGSNCCDICRCGGYDRKTFACADCAAETNRAIDNFAHELAEQQRTLVEHPEDWHPIFVRAVNKAADVIDPETS